MPPSHTAKPSQAQRKPKAKVSDSVRTATPALAHIVSHVELRPSPDNVLQLQQAIGNRATGRLLNLNPKSDVQRDEDTTATTNEDEVVEWWEVPFDGGTAYTYAEALDGLVYVEDFINDVPWSIVPPERHEEIRGIQEETWPLMDLVEEKEGELERADAAALGVFGKVANDLWNSTVAEIKRAVEPSLEDIEARQDLERQKADLQESLHFAFIEGADEAHIKALQDSIESINDYKDKVDKVVGWAKDGLSKLKKAKAGKYLEKVEEISGKFGDVLGYASDAADVAETIHGLATGRGAEGSLASVNQFKSAVKAIDMTMSFAKCAPLLGQLWSNYYEPMTQECLKMVGELSKMVDKDRRLLTLVDWANDSEKQRLPDGSPKIPELMAELFPGDQAVLSYMWSVCNNGQAVANSEVEAFFAKKRDQFNAGVDDGEVKLKTESEWSVLDPFDIIQDDRAVNLDQFVAAHKDMIWTMLYGSIPQDLSLPSS